MTPHILFIDRSSSSCGTCFAGAYPRDTAHDVAAGYGGAAPGCGAVWTHVSTHYMGEDQERAVRAMRSDLEWMDIGEAGQIETAARLAKAGLTGSTWPAGIDYEGIPW